MLPVEKLLKSRKYSKIKIKAYTIGYDIIATTQFGLTFLSGTTFGMLALTYSIVNKFFGNKAFPSKPLDWLIVTTGALIITTLGASSWALYYSLKNIQNKLIKEISNLNNLENMISEASTEIENTGFKSPGFSNEECPIDLAGPKVDLTGGVETNSYAPAAA